MYYQLKKHLKFYSKRPRRIPNAFRDFICLLSERVQRRMRVLVLQMIFLWSRLTALYRAKSTEIHDSYSSFTVDADFTAEIAS